ncbi:unnamed protein product [Brachionus calyciflorus]|uniref:SH2 domain-containing protein n=1 Tax=Brachionus calyciflorus TaxID=104777 RepID=A0A814LTC6_9BILA|nr:unnamed protein product [Brachionus calyciflorus]
MKTSSFIQKLKLKLKKFETVENYDEQKWYKRDWTRQTSEQFLSNKQIGVFVIRQSESIEQALVLSVKVPIYIHSSQVCHYVLIKSKNGLCIRGNENKMFKTLNNLVDYCSNTRDLIPVKLDVDYYILESNTIYNRSNSLNSISSNHSDFSFVSSENEL